MPSIIGWFQRRFGGEELKPAGQSGTSSAITFQNAYALLVGVGADLPGTIDDARGLHDVLVDPGRCGYMREHVRLLTGGEAHRDNILSGIEWLAQQAGDADTAIVYFSGHGVRQAVDGGFKYYLMPHGYSLGDLEHTAIDGDAFGKRLGAIKTRKLLLLLDCCHAGGIELAKIPSVDKAPLPAASGSMLAAGKGRFLIASSRANEVSLAGKPYSAFTLALLEALCGAGASVSDGYVRASDLTQYTYAAVTQRTSNRQHPMTDFAEADNFAVSYYAGGETQAKAPPFATPQIEDERGQLAPAPSSIFYQPGWQVDTVQNFGPSSGAITINIGQRSLPDDVAGGQGS